MKINISKYMGICAIAFGFIACNPSDFGNMNVDPNNTTNPQPALVFTSAMRAISGTITGTQGTHYAQYISHTQYTSASLNSVSRFNYGGYYTGAIMDLDFLIEYNTNPDTKDLALAAGSNENQIAVAMILKAYFYNHITDRWGDIPYSEAIGALSSEDLNFKPKFDSQQSVYTGLFAELNTAVNMINTGANGVQGDILFGGDMGRWRQFANSLRFIMALRIQDADAGTSNSQMAAALAAPGGVIGAGEDIMYSYLAEAANQNPWYARFITRIDWAVSNVIMQYMNPSDERSDAGDPTAFGFLDAGKSDPRRPIYANASVTGAVLYGNEFIGMPFGVIEAVAGSYTNDEVSLFGNPLRTQDAPGFIISVAEIEFAKAEASSYGVSTGGDMASHYTAGIQASMDQYNVDIGDYMTNAMVSFAGQPSMDQVHTQRWIANYTYGYQGWATWRRTNVPALVPTVDFVNNSGEIPVRQGYPTTERDLNGVNYEAANNAQGVTSTNILDVRVWWDVADNY